ncbi:Formyltetrahydrofolate deformylase, partial [termite gut metagenome]
MKQPTAILLIHCPDQPGIIAVVTDFITINGGNIIYLDQHVDREQKVFFMRVEWELGNFAIPKDKIEEYFNTLYALKYDMYFRLYFNNYRPRMAVFVSKMSHCIYELLARYAAGEWNVEIPLIISNHVDLENVAIRFGFMSLRVFKVCEFLNCFVRELAHSLCNIRLHRPGKLQKRHDHCQPKA